MKKETVIKNEWENAWFCNLKDLQADPKVNGAKITFSTPVRNSECTYWICRLNVSFMSMRRIGIQFVGYQCLKNNWLKKIVTALLYNYSVIIQKLSEIIAGGGGGGGSRPPCPPLVSPVASSLPGFFLPNKFISKIAIFLVSGTR